VRFTALLTRLGIHQRESINSTIYNSLSFLFLIIIIAGFVGRFSDYFGNRASSESHRDAGSLGLDLSSVPAIGTPARKTLLVALATKCIYCEQSAAFHKLLVNAAKKAGVQTIAVFPEFTDLREASIKIDQEGLSFDHVYAADLEKLKIRGTPTLYLSDASGRISFMWEGLQTVTQAENLFSSVTGGDASKALIAAAVNNSDDDLLTAEKFKELMKTVDSLQVLDIRARDEYKKSHLVGAINIPHDELETRLVHELRKDKPIYLFCEYSPDCEIDAARLGATTFCGYVSKLIELQGGKQVQLISESIESLSSSNPALLVKE